MLKDWKLLKTNLFDWFDKLYDGKIWKKELDHYICTKCNKAHLVSSASGMPSLFPIHALSSFMPFLSPSFFSSRAADS